MKILPNFAARKKNVRSLLHARRKVVILRSTNKPIKVRTMDLIKIAEQAFQRENAPEIPEFKAGDTGFSVDQTANTVSLTGLTLSNGAHTAHFIGNGRDRVFIPPQAMTRQGWQEGELVGALAVYAYNSKRNQWAWRTV